MGDIASERHLQVFSLDDDEQEAFTEVGVTGTMPDGLDADVLTVTANNAVGGKQDVHLGHRTTMDIELGAPQQDLQDRITASRLSRLRVDVDNPLPESGRDLYIIGNCEVMGDRSGCFEGPTGWNRTWFTVWGPSETRLQDVRSEDDAGGTAGGVIHGLRAIDTYLETPPEGSAGFEMDLVAEVPLRIEDGALVYELTWWAQSKAIPDLLDVTITPPDGWRVADVTLTGGGEGRGLGVHGDGEALALEAGDGEARITGTVTADTTFRVELVGEDR